MEREQPTKTNESLLGPADIARIRDEGIEQTVAYACRKSSFWRGRLSQAGLSPADVTSADRLEAVPLTHKADLAAAGSDMWCVEPRQVVDIVTTSGTTGAPTLYPLTSADIQRLGYNEYLSFSCAGITADDVVLIAVTMNRCFMAGLAYYEGLRQIGAAAIRVGSGLPGLVMDMIDRLGATAIVSVPSFLKIIAARAAERGYRLDTCPVTRLICIGEPVRQADLSLTSLAGEIEAAWGAKVYSTYGATEIAGSLCECAEGVGGHLHPELLHLEILDEQGRPVEVGRVGQVVATSLAAEAMPLIRFRTGDMAYMTNSPCRCGLQTPRIGPILGRKNQMLKIKGTTVYPMAVRQAMEAVKQVAEYAIMVTAPNPLSDHMEVVASVTGDVDEARRQIEERLQGAIKVTPAIRIATTQEVVDLRGDGSGRKNRFFIDRRPGRMER